MRDRESDDDNNDDGDNDADDDDDDDDGEHTLVEQGLGDTGRKRIVAKTKST